MTLSLNGRSHDVLTHIGIPDRPLNRSVPMLVMKSPPLYGVPSL